MRVPRALLSALALWLPISTLSFAEPLRDISQPLCSSLEADFSGSAVVQSPNCRAPGDTGQHPGL